MGKTTTLHSVMVPSRSGNIRFQGQELRELPSYQIAKTGLSLVPEGRQIFPNLTATKTWWPPRPTEVRGKIPEPRSGLRPFPQASEPDPPWATSFRRGTADARDRPRTDDQPEALQILDEATEGLRLIRNEIWNCVSNLKSAGQSILLVDKNIDALTRIADRHYIIEKGKVVWKGTPSELQGRSGSPAPFPRRLKHHPHSSFICKKSGFYPIDPRWDHPVSSRFIQDGLESHPPPPDGGGLNTRP